MTGHTAKRQEEGARSACHPDVILQGGVTPWGCRGQEEV